ncbi:DUF1697 domain-containing protein [Polaromonas sp. A23]|uniref:DUF1697 domain-containing protein n=1 Tax=Polaromonas sp. A23 TaxID=1944133 RepID=UPI000986EC4F|nr:DUF1697 domain-containing protein [Polaromonas sp. A23]OOG39918.1 hypothetical protein B0B52_15010 [Polaromonas sp. A23]
MKHAVFFRNLNLGRANCPDKAQLEAAFLAAGADTAASFLTNGTLVFSVRSNTAARKVLALACRLLQAECGLKEPAYVRQVDYLVGLVASHPFKSVAPGSVYACCVSFLPAKYAEPPAWPRASARGDVEILGVNGTEVFSVSRQIAKSPGSPNAFLEKLLGSPVTTRNWNTVVRLVGKHDAP